LAFLEITKVKVLEEVEMFPNSFYHPDEIQEIKSSDGFHMFSSNGYYITNFKKVLIDPSSEITKANWCIIDSDI